MSVTLRRMGSRSAPGARPCRKEGRTVRKIFVPRLTAAAVAVLLTGLLPFPTNADFITFGVPGGNNTTVSAINDGGTVTGSYNAPAPGSPLRVVSYLRDAAGNFTTFDVPGLASTIATGINNTGTVVGYNTFGFGPGFLRDAAGNITTFQIPGISPGFLVGVFIPKINDAGTIAGNYSSLSNGPSHGFLRDVAGNITTFDAPGSSSTSVGAINNAGTVLGSSNSPSFPNFLRAAAGNFSTFSVPGSDSTLFGAINDAGTVAGTFVASGLRHGFLRDAAGNFTTFDIPGATSIGVEAINDHGMVAGIFTAGGLQQGFLRDAAGNVTAFNPLPSGVVVGVSLNNAGVLAGTIFLSSGDRIGFVGTPSATAVVPEPPSIVLLGLGAAGLAIGRRQHRNRGRRGGPDGHVRAASPRRSFLGPARVIGLRWGRPGAARHR